MSFNFNSEQDSIRYSTFLKMQRASDTGAFLNKGQYYASWIKSQGSTDIQGVKEKYGFDITDGQKVLFCYAMADVNNYVSVPVVWAFVIDELGVVRKYKIGGTGNSRVGWKPVKEKLELQFERASTPETPVWILDADKPHEFVDENEQVIAKLMGIEEGKQRIQGAVLSIKTEYQNRGYYSGYNQVTKMLVVANNGVKYYGTVPKALLNKEGFGKGAVVEFTGTVKVCEAGVFAVYSRPSSPKIVTAAVIEQVTT